MMSEDQAALFHIARILEGIAESLKAMTDALQSIQRKLESAEVTGK
jgi:hypothetical protein